LCDGIGARVGPGGEFCLGTLCQSLFRYLIEFLVTLLLEVRIGRVFHETAAPARDGTFGPTNTDTINDELIYRRETVI
jgi:hypothetical protein